MKDKKTYKAKGGAQFDRKKTQIYGHFLNHLAKSNKGKLTSKEVVNRARSEDSPIHDCFEWNDDKAAEGVASAPMSSYNSSSTCPECYSSHFEIDGGCEKCRDCGYSKCG